MTKTNRLNKVVENMSKKGLKQLIVTSPASIFYLTGKWIEAGERMLVLYINSNGKNVLLINELFPLSEDIGIDKVIFNDREDPVKILSDFIMANEKLGIDKNWPSHFLISLMEAKPGLTFVNGSDVIDEVRLIKDSEEINLMREASKVNDKVISDVISIMKNGYSEKKVCKILSDIYEKYNTDSFSFYPLIAYGANAAEPHHNSDESLPKQGDSIIIDIGGRTNMYCSDMTRTIFFGKPSEEAEKVYSIVAEANKRGIEAVKPGARFCDVDLAARSFIESKGYGKYFTHRTGHNIGIEVHEYCDVSSVNQMELKPGMIFSVEPGIYLPGQLGVRVEDLVVVTDNGCEVLNSYTKDFQTI